MKQIYTPEGMQDILIEEGFNMRNMEADIRKHLRMCGYYEIITPTLEYYDVFTSGPNTMDSEMMYKLTDKNGQILVLRPDLTIPAARVFTTKIVGDKAMPKKLFYIGNVFRFNEVGGGKTNEFTQAGVEIMGQDGCLVDAEVIAKAIEISLLAGLENFQIDIGHSEFFIGIMEECGFSDKETEETRLLVEKKDFAGLELMLKTKGVNDNVGELVLSIPQLFGDATILDKAALYAHNEKSLNAIETLREILRILDDYKLSEYVSIDLGMVGSLKYYTGTIFKGYTYGVGFPYLGGGRYDTLTGNFGKKIPASGFSLGINILMKALIRQGMCGLAPSCDAFVGFVRKYRKEAIEISQFFRENNISTHLDISEYDEGAAVEFARNEGFKLFLYVREDGKVRYINFNNGVDRIIDYQDIIEWGNAL